MTDNEQTDLENLVKSPGWLRFVERAEADCISSVLQRLDQMSSEGTVELATKEILQAAAVRRAVTRLLRWPKERLGQLSTPQVAPVETATRWRV